MHSGPEFENIINSLRNILDSNYTNGIRPYRQITCMAAKYDNLNIACQILQPDVYTDKIAQNVRYLLAMRPDRKVINNDFDVGELIYTLAYTYEDCYDRFIPQGRRQIGGIIMDVLSPHYKKHMIRKGETHIFDNHFW